MYLYDLLIPNNFFEIINYFSKFDIFLAEILSNRLCVWHITNLHMADQIMIPNYRKALLHDSMHLLHDNSAIIVQ